MLLCVEMERDTRAGVEAPCGTDRRISATFRLARALGDGVRSQYSLIDPLPQRWLELLAELGGPAETPTNLDGSGGASAL
jgi:hypothetical protein